MKREIKFRGKRVDKGDWVFGLYCGETNNGCYCLIGNAETHGKTGCHVYPETVGQYTGLKDMNGKDIYEGDIVYAHKNQGTYTVHHGLYIHICMDNDGEKPDCYGWYIKIDAQTEPVYGESLDDSDKHLKSIGNIHDNPELLEDH